MYEKAAELALRACEEYLRNSTAIVESGSKVDRVRAIAKAERLAKEALEALSTAKAERLAKEASCDAGSACDKCGSPMKWVDLEAQSGQHGTVWMDVFDCPECGRRYVPY